MLVVKAKDTVEIYNNEGVFKGYGIIININEFRHPSQKYAVDADFYKEDFLFLGDVNIKKVAK